jgi:hypothetical protein
VGADRGGQQGPDPQHDAAVPGPVHKAAIRQYGIDLGKEVIYADHGRAAHGVAGHFPRECYGGTHHSRSTASSPPRCASSSQIRSDPTGTEAFPPSNRSPAIFHRQPTIDPSERFICEARRSAGTRSRLCGYIVCCGCGA